MLFPLSSLSAETQSQLFTFVYPWFIFLPFHLKAWRTSVQFCTVAFSQSVASKCVTQQQKALLWKLSFIWLVLLLMQRNGIIVEAIQLPRKAMVTSVIITKVKYLGNSYIMQCIILFVTPSPPTYLSHLHLTRFKIFQFKTLKNTMLIFLFQWQTGDALCLWWR